MTFSAAVILPVLDERDAIPWVLGRMPAEIHPIIVDNGSTDGSDTVARSLGAQVVHEPARGFGSACFAGLEAATADIVLFMDCDASLDPVHLTTMARIVADGEADLVLGARQAELHSWPLHARAANRFLARTLRRRFGWSITDLGPMRAAHRQPLLDLGITDRRSGWPLEMALRAGRASWHITEIPVPYHPRTGRSKVTGTIRGTLQAIGDMERHLRTLG